MDTASRLSPSRRANRRMFVAITAMMAVWLVIVLCRNPIRAWWWTHKLTDAVDPQIRLTYFQRLVALGPTGAIAVESLLTSEDTAVRGLGVALLNHTKPERSGELLLRMSRDPDLEVAMAAVTGLTMLGDTAVVHDLTDLLKSADPRLATLAVTGLGRLRTPQALDLLIETAKHHDIVGVRIEAIEELGRLQDERAVEVLTACLDDDTPFEGITASERWAATLLARVAPGMAMEPPLRGRPVSHFAARALQEIITTNGR